MVIERSIVIARPPEDVFAFVADPANDVEWCRKVRSVEAVPGDPDRWRVVHKPVPGKPERSGRSSATLPARRRIGENR